jgi:methyl-accepting chemotaxis protein
MTSGKAYFEVVDNGTNLRVVKPAIASKNYLGKNCTMCHIVPEGTALGAVSMKISLSKFNDQTLAGLYESVGLVIVLSAPFVIFLYFFIRSAVTNPLLEMEKSLSEIASGEGDLTKRLPVHGKDEISNTASAFNRMMNKIAELVRHVSESATKVAGAAVDLDGTAARVNDGSQQQTEAATATVQAVDKVTAMIRDIAHNTDSVREQSRESLASAESGSRSLEKHIAEMTSVEASVRTMSET